MTGRGRRPGKEPHRYRQEILSDLLEHGLAPRPESDPRAVYELLKSIYTFEIRQANCRRRERERLLGPQPLEDYRRAIHALKARYRVLGVHWREWLVPE